MFFFGCASTCTLLYQFLHDRLRPNCLCDAYTGADYKPSHEKVHCLVFLV